MKKRTFLTYEKPLLTCMVQADNPDRIKELIDASLPEGAEAIGMQFCKLKAEYRNEEIYKDLLSYSDLPVYVTNYRKHNSNAGKSDDVLAAELLTFAECGATLCDVMGDYFCPHPEELTDDPAAIEKQMLLIEQLHREGAEVLMSSHVLKFTPAERVLEIAKEQVRRGADIVKIVTGAETMEQQIENLRITDLLKRELGAPFLFLSGGMSTLHRRLGLKLGCCMALCVYEHDVRSTAAQPLLSTMKTVRDSIDF